MLKTRHFQFTVIFLILINTHLSKAYLCDSYDTNCGWSIFFIMIVIFLFFVAFLCCICYDCCLYCNESSVTTTTQDEPTPYYLRNETVNMNQVRNQTTYNCETLPQSLPDFGLPKRPTIQNNQHNGMTLSLTTLPSAPQAYFVNSNRTYKRHANYQNSPQPLPRFQVPQTISSSTDQYNTHNNMTLSPTSMLSSSTPLPSWAPPAYSENSNNSSQILPQSSHTTDQDNEQSGATFSSTATEVLNGEWINGTWVQNDITLSPTSMHSSTSPLASDPPPYSEISIGEWINGTWVNHSNSEILPQPLPGASERFSGPESEATCSKQNEKTTSPNPILYSYSS